MPGKTNRRDQKETVQIGEQEEGESGPAHHRRQRLGNLDITSCKVKTLLSLLFPGLRRKSYIQMTMLPSLLVDGHATFFVG